MNIEEAKLNQEGLDMTILIPITPENNEYMEKLSNTEGLRFSDILNKMIIEHKKRGFINDGEGDRKGNEEESSIKKNRGKKNKGDKNSTE